MYGSAFSLETPRIALAGWILAASVCGAPSSHAITIDIVLGQSSEMPSYDADRSRMLALFNHAANYYEDIFEDNDFTVQIAVSYITFVDPDLLGMYNGIVNTIQMDTDTSWYFDNTPADDSEFNMGQTLWRNLNTTDRNDFYNFDAAPAVPDTFEVGYTGVAFADTDVMVGQHDMLTVVLHEIGHALGMGTIETPLETALDFDYDFDSDWVNGATLASEQGNFTGDDKLNFGHIEATDALMSPSIPEITRKLPSHTDLFSMAASLGLQGLDIPRREFYFDDFSNEWNDDANWSGARAPGALDEAFVRDSQGDGSPGAVVLAANGVAGALHVSAGATVSTSSFKLDVTGDVDVSGAGSSVRIGNSGELEADDVVILSEAEVTLFGGTIDVDTLSLGADTELRTPRGDASIVVASKLVNDGLIVTGDIAVADVGHITFTSPAANPWDLDGDDGEGRIEVRKGNLHFDTGGLADAFSGTLLIDSGYEFRVDADWEVESNGLIEFVRDGTLAGGILGLRGRLMVKRETARIDSNIDLQSQGNIRVFDDADLIVNGILVHAGFVDVDASGDMDVNGPAFMNAGANSDIDGHLDFNGQTTFNAGSLTGSGTVRINNAAIVFSETEINMGSFQVGSAGNVAIRGADVTADSLFVAGDLSLQEDVTVVAGSVTLADGSTTTLTDGEIDAGSFERRSGASFNHQGGTLRISGGIGTYNSSLTLGSASSPLVRIQDGADVSVTFSWKMALDAGEFANLVVVGTDGGTSRSSLVGTGGGAGADLVIGGAGNAVVLVNAGGLIHLRDDVVVGETAGGQGQLTIAGVTDGFRSTVDVTAGGGNSLIDLAPAGTAIVNVSSGGLLQTSSDLLMARGADSTAFLTIGGNVGGFDAEVVVGDDIFVGGSESAAGGDAQLTLNTGGRISGEHLQLWNTSSLILDGGAVEVTSFARTSGGTLQFDGGQFTIVGGDAIFNSGIALGGAEVNQPTFQVLNGGDAIVTSNWHIGAAAGEHATTLVSGTSADGSRRSTLRNTSGGPGADIYVGRFGTGTLIVADGGRAAFLDDFEIARDGANSAGVATVRGVRNVAGMLIRSEIDVTAGGTGAALTVGRLGDGELNIESGALVRVTGNVTLAAAAGSTGLLNVGGTAEGFPAELDAANSELRVGGTANAPEDIATVNVSSGGLITANSLLVRPTGSLNIGGGELVVNSINQDVGSSIDLTGGQLTVDGGAATLTDALFFGGTDQTDQPTFVAQNGATVTASSSTIGGLPGEFAHLMITGATSAATRTTLDLANATIAFRGTAELSVTDGADANIVSQLVAGSSGGSDGTVLVSGVPLIDNDAVRSTLNAGSMRIATQGIGELVVENGARAHSFGNVTLGEFHTARGTVTIASASGGFDATLEVDGQLSIGSAGGAHGEMNVNNGGLLQATDVAVFQNGEFNLSGGRVQTDQITLHPGATFEMSGGVINVESFDGHLAPLGGTVAPGTSAGTTSVTGDYLPGSAATLEIEIGGLTAGTDFDVLDVVGTATLAGGLEVLLTGGFSPALGNTFEIVTAANVVGAFDASTLPDLGANGWDIAYQPSGVILEVVDVLLPGDLNGDGAVNFADLTPFALGLTDVPAYEEMFPDVDRVTVGDINLDTAFNFGDLTPFVELLTGGGASSSAVPEPTSAILAALVAVGFVALGRWRISRA